MTGFGAMCADLILGVAVYVLQRGVDIGGVIRYVYVLGCGVMLFFAYRVISRPAPTEEAPGTGVRAFASALGVGLSNPFQILWWLTVGLAVAYLGGFVLFLGLFGAILVWIVTFPYSVHAGVRRYPQSRRYIVWVSGAILFGFAVYFAVLAA